MARNIAQGFDASRNLEKILGISRIRRFELAMSYDSIAEATVTFLLTKEQLKALTGDGITAMEIPAEAVALESHDV